MAERLKEKLLEEEKLVDMVVGPDAYRDLPNLVGQVEEGQKGINTFLSREETYADISPVRLNSNGVSALISIMRGCDNMCSFCVVPFTRGRERSRDPYSITKEAQELFDKGYKEVTSWGKMWTVTNGLLRRIIKPGSIKKSQKSLRSFIFLTCWRWSPRLIQSLGFDFPPPIPKTSRMRSCIP